jgi:acetyl-CoA carboxylase biotin carboxyl carrier protein
MDLRKLKTLIDLVAESGISELEVHEGEDKVRIVKSSQQSGVPQTHYAPVPAMAGPAPAALGSGIEAAPIPKAPEGNIVTSPMVGTFYRAPGPGKPAFVELGQTVKSAEPVCIIEAMKLLNEIEAGFDGTIREILVENGQPVEFGQPLFVVV